MSEAPEKRGWVAVGWPWVLVFLMPTAGFIGAMAAAPKFLPDGFRALTLAAGLLSALLPMIGPWSRLRGTVVRIALACALPAAIGLSYTVAQSIGRYGSTNVRNASLFEVIVLTLALLGEWAARLGGPLFRLLLRS